MKWKTKSKIRQLLWKTPSKYSWYKQQIVWNGIEKTVDPYEMLWLNEKHYKEGLDQKNLQEITKKYNSNHKNIDMN